MHDDEKNNIEQLSSVWMFVEGLLARILKRSSEEEETKKRREKILISGLDRVIKNGLSLLCCELLRALLFCCQISCSLRLLYECSMLNTATEIDKFQLCCCAIFIVPSEGGFFVLGSVAVEL